MALRVDGVAMVSFITDSIVGEDANDGAVCDSINLGSCLSRWKRRERIISKPNDIDSVAKIPFKDLDILAIKETAICSTIHEGSVVGGSVSLVLTRWQQLANSKVKPLTVMGAPDEAEAATGDGAGAGDRAAPVDMAWHIMELGGREVPGRELAIEAASVGVGNTTEVARGAAGAGACWDRLICLPQCQLQRVSFCALVKRRNCWLDSQIAASVG